MKGWVKAIRQIGIDNSIGDLLWQFYEWFSALRYRNDYIANLNSHTERARRDLWKSPAAIVQSKDPTFRHLRAHP